MNRHERRTRAALAKRADKAVRNGKPVVLPPGMSAYVACGDKACNAKASHLLRHYAFPKGKRRIDSPYTYSLFCEDHATSEMRRIMGEAPSDAELDHEVTIEPWKPQESPKALLS